MIKRVGFNHFPNKGSNISKQGNNFSKQYNNYPKQMSNPSKPSNDLLKPSTGLPKSTKTLLIAVIAIIVIIVLFFIIRGIINGNKDETLVDKLDADFIISEVQVLNYTDIIFKVDGNMSKGNVDSINLIIYNENDSVILRKKILISDLEENDFYINIHVTNTSKIKEISVTPTFLNEEGKKVVGEVEDEYTLTDEEKYNSNGENNELPLKEEPLCKINSECNDNNTCTTDNCSEGECSHTDVSECIPCKSSSECEDSITCTTNTCSNGKCSYLAIPGCVSCASGLDCDDSNSCTENICSGGRCLYTPMESCVSCSLDSECEDNDICTENICSNGACSYVGMSGCKTCSSNFQCNDSDFSTKDSCINGKCNYTKITSCINNDKYCPSGCTITNDNDCVYIPVCGNGIREGDEKCDLSAFGGATCAGALGTGYTGTLKCTKICTFNTSLCAPPCTCSNDNNICTADGCVNNVCQHVPLTGNSCTNDNNVCTNDICSSSGTCKHIPLTGNSCTDDNNICTNDVCSSNGVCIHPAIPGCCLTNAQCISGKSCVNNACVGNQPGGFVKIFIIGDSTAQIYDPNYNSDVGWGMELQQFFNSQNVLVVDNAVGGSSSKSYYESDYWTETYDSMSSGDYLFIQFAHNDEHTDEPDKYTDPYTTYKDYLQAFIDGAREKGVYPILLTPVERNQWSGSTLIDSHGDYPDAMRELAQEENVPLIDLTEKTRALYYSLGESYITNYFFVSGDPTHFKLKGANETAKLVIQGIKELGSSTGLIDYIKGSTSTPPITPPTSTTGKIYYVSPSGSDSNSGTIGSPWYSLEKAWSYLVAGDTLYMRGGRYTGYPATMNLEDKSGTSGNMINIWNYPGEKPVIDYAGFIATSEEDALSLRNINYVHFKGIRITNLVQVPDAVVLRGMILWDDVNNCIFEQMETDHIGGWGVTIGDNSKNNLFLNFDSHHNSDQYSEDSYGGADGFQTGSHAPGRTSTNNTFRGCRAWWNSDDGWDLRVANGLYIIENSWSFWNGYKPGTFDSAGNGEGFKAGTSAVLSTSTSETRRVIKNCLSFENKLVGIGSSPNDGYAGMEVYNTVVYGNLEGMNFDYDVPAILKNNIAYNNGDDFRDSNPTVHNHNSFDSSVTVTDSDFLSLDSSCMDDPRKADGSLPDCNFLKLKQGSDLIDKGVNVGLPYKGSAPDIGAYETNY